MIPTKEQIKELWEGCGFTFNTERLHDGDRHYDADCFCYPDLSKYPHQIYYLPPIDLNNLVTYGVTLLQNKGYVIVITCYVHCGYGVKIHSVIKDIEFCEHVHPKLKDALFWAIQEVLKRAEQ